jgi:general secretion pathway protein G
MARYSDHPKRDGQAGLTLLEMMIVLAIIALIAGLAGPRLIENFGRAKSRAAAIQMTNLKGALQLFYIDAGRYPTEAEGLSVLLTAPSGVADWKGPYLEGDEATIDPWQRSYIYRSPASDGPYELSTYGRDGVAGGTREDSDISL